MNLVKMNEVAKELGITLTQKEGFFCTKPCKRERAWEIADVFVSRGFAVNTWTEKNKTQVNVDPNSYNPNITSFRKEG